MTEMLARWQALGLTAADRQAVYDRLLAGEHPGAYSDYARESDPREGRAAAVTTPVRTYADDLRRVLGADVCTVSGVEGSHLVAASAGETWVLLCRDGRAVTGVVLAEDEVPTCPTCRRAGERAAAEALR